MRRLVRSASGVLMKIMLVFAILATASACGTQLDPRPESCTDKAPITPPGESAELAVMYHQQHTQVWCWAAVSSAVTDYFRHVMGQDCQFLSAYAYKQFGQMIDCCYYPDACNRPALSMQEIESALEVVGGVYSTRAGHALTEAALRTELASGRPVIAGLMASSSGHVIVISGFDAAGYHVQDPFWGEYRGVAYAALLQNPQLGNWADTLFLLGTANYCQ